MTHFQLQFMKCSQIFHALLNILILQRITNSGTIQKFCDFISIFWINIRNIITNIFFCNFIIYLCFLSPIDKLIGTFSWNTHNIFLSFASKQERPIRHTFFQNRNIDHLFSSGIKGLTDYLNCICF